MADKCQGIGSKCTPCLCEFSQEQLEDMGYGFGNSCPNQDCLHDCDLHFKEPYVQQEAIEINDTDDGEESNEERESSIYDEYYFEMKRSQARPNVITHVCVLSVIVHGPYGLMRNGIRDFFRDKLRPYMPSDGHIKWSHSGTKLRIILANYQPEEKTNVLSVLDKLITDGSDFHYVEKCDISFQHDALTPECVLTSIATPTRRERSRTMSSYASEGDKCHNEKCLVTHGITRLCKKCRSVKYCSRKCLKADADRHGLVCKPCSPGKPIGKPNSPRK